MNESQSFKRLEQSNALSRKHKHKQSTDIPCRNKFPNATQKQERSKQRLAATTWPRRRKTSIQHENAKILKVRPLQKWKTQNVLGERTKRLLFGHKLN